MKASQHDTSSKATLTRISPATLPVCQQAGTSNEGWYLKGELLKKSPCDGRTADCLKQESQEGWFAFVRKDVRLVRYDTCTGKGVPTCVNVGTKSEGWQGEDWFQWDTCNGLAIMCDGIGTRSEGWHSFEPLQSEFISSTSCEHF